MFGPALFIAVCGEQFDLFITFFVKIGCVFFHFLALGGPSLFSGNAQENCGWVVVTAPSTMRKSKTADLCEIPIFKGRQLHVRMFPVSKPCSNASFMMSSFYTRRGSEVRHFCKKIKILIPGIVHLAPVSKFGIPINPIGDPHQPH